MRFDGKAFAREIETEVALDVAKLAKKPHVVSILVGNDPASELYTKLKEQAAERVGIDFSIEKLDVRSKIQDVRKKIIKIGEDPSVDGLMLQLPVPHLTRIEQKELLKYIPIEKDIDGLRWEESHIMPATVAAVLEVLKKLSVLRDLAVTVVGSEGNIGKPLVHFLTRSGYRNVNGVDIDTPDRLPKISHADVLISCVGKPGMITEDMIKPGIVAVDVGISQKDGKVSGDMTRGVYAAASLSVEVPGGIGPVTVASLMRTVAKISGR
jgi:methylenetetrahydrofolate dehydrogenase (NADP+)/methenyltetrahydrofolate cyclohydrolase